MADDDVTEDEFLAELLQHLGHSNVKQAVEEALREYVGDGEGADRLVFETFVREVTARALRKVQRLIRAEASQMPPTSIGGMDMRGDPRADGMYRASKIIAAQISKGGKP